MKHHESFPLVPQQIAQLKKLVLQGEGFQLEFKRKAAYPDKIVKEMIAFANAKGGIVLIGIGDDKTIPGLKHPEDDAHVIKLALNNCKPALPVHETYIPINANRVVLQYVVHESTKKPHYYLTADKLKETFVRVDDKCIKASRELREISKRTNPKKGVRFHYGDHERLLMRYLDEHATITLKQFIEISGLKKFNASNKLVLLVLANVLRITPDEKGDRFSSVIS